MASIFGRRALRTSPSVGHALTRPATRWAFQCQPRTVVTATSVKNAPPQQFWSDLTPAEAAAKSAPLTRTITMVKKLMPDGSPCRKCNEIQERLEKDGLQDRIDSVLYMDPSTPGVDPGTKIAMQHGIKTAPFFVVRTLTGGSSDGQEVVDEHVYTAYLRMKKQVFGKKASVAEADNDVAMSIF